MRATILLAVSVLAGAVIGQVPTGTFVRGLAPGEIHNSEATTLGEFAGRLVLVEFFAYW